MGDLFIEATPGEVINKAGLPALLRNGCKGGDPQSGEMADFPEGGNGDVTCPCLFGQLCSHEVPFIRGRGVCVVAHGSRDILLCHVKFCGDWEFMLLHVW